MGGVNIPATSVSRSCTGVICTGGITISTYQSLPGFPPTLYYLIIIYYYDYSHIGVATSFASCSSSLFTAATASFFFRLRHEHRAAHASRLRSPSRPSCRWLGPHLASCRDSGSRAARASGPRARARVLRHADAVRPIRAPSCALPCFAFSSVACVVAHAASIFLAAPP